MSDSQKNKASNGRFANNTAMLYVLTFSNYFFGLVTIPYLTRVLGPETYGQVGVAMAFAMFMQVIFDFGFILSSTAKVAKAQQDLDALSLTFWNVTYFKLGLVLLSGAIFLVAWIILPKGTFDFPLFALYFSYVAINAFIPDFLYRGMEHMSKITIRTVGIKVLFTMLVYIFVSSPQDYLLVPLFYLMGSAGALVIVLLDIHKSYGICFVAPQVRGALDEGRESVQYFASRLMLNAYTTFNTIILGAMYPASSLVGFYSANGKLITAGKNAFTPLSDSLYPHMVRTRDYSLFKKIFPIGLVFVIVTCAFAFVFAEDVCGLLFGEEYRMGGDLLRCMLPILPIEFASHMIGFPALTPLGLQRFANISVMVGSCYQLVGFVVLFVTHAISVYSIALLTCSSELLVLCIRLAALVYGFKKERELNRC